LQQGIFSFGMDVDLSFAAHGNGYVLIEWQILNHQEAVGHEGNGGTRQATKLLQVLRELDANQKFIRFVCASCRMMF